MNPIEKQKSQIERMMSQLEQKFSHAVTPPSSRDPQTPPDPSAGYASMSIKIVSTTTPSPSARPWR